TKTPAEVITRLILIAASSLLDDPPRGLKAHYSLKATSPRILKREVWHFRRTLTDRRTICYNSLAIAPLYCCRRTPTKHARLCALRRRRTHETRARRWLRHDALLWVGDLCIRARHRRHRRSRQ